MPNKPNAVELAREQLLEDAELIVACYKAGSDYVCEGDYNCARYVLRVQPVVEAARELHEQLTDETAVAGKSVSVLRLHRALAALEGGGEE
jgi:hypothetical protein